MIGSRLAKDVSHYYVEFVGPGRIASFLQWHETTDVKIKVSHLPVALCLQCPSVSTFSLPKCIYSRSKNPSKPTAIV